MFAVPGAFTPTCSAKHLPGFVQNVDAMKAKGVDTVVCMAVNDPFVLAAWARTRGRSDRDAGGRSGAFTRALGLELDLMGRGLGIRSQRFALIAEDGRVTHLAVEQPGDFDVSRAESLLKTLCERPAPLPLREGAGGGATLGSVRGS